ncbi:4a-hydroxytetrahydrobiopterin dehydratase [Deinococcus rubellus]|uniref:4a-hydroxytetrahydrobiopterin dehydratase n=1 Tax=Deinococcus rubellus TaxID=1889240 RepID=A0ABY5YK95_9DEIO|nr:4a-hydroxytetrahydrobiopterin dehydratase [Deinococcus rubellus]UWX65522.1 4a-hydroxytetrahydrobiopterin dehydratase [Deinococcus rubellus]
MSEHTSERERLTDGDVQERKPQGWWGDDGKLFRLFEFDSYRQGLDFVVRVAELAEAQNHHPDITLKYKKVHVEYVTHETNSIVGGVTELDLRGAEAVNSIFELPGEALSGEG